MQSLVVVIFLPVFQFLFGFRLWPEKCFIQTFITQLANEALDESILRRFSGLDIVPVNIIILHPFENCHAGAVRRKQNVSDWQKSVFIYAVQSCHQLFRGAMRLGLKLQIEMVVNQRVPEINFAIYSFSKTAELTVLVAKTVGPGRGHVCKDTPRHCLCFKASYCDWDHVRRLHQRQWSHVPHKKAGHMTATCKDCFQFNLILAKSGPFTHCNEK